MYGISEKYLKLQEYPFSSEQKLMAVKCVNKYDDVRFLNETYFIISSINYFYYIIKIKIYRLKKKFILSKVL